MIDSIITGFVAIKLIQISNFKLGFIEAVQFFTNAQEQTVLSQSPLLAPIGFIQVKEGLVPNHETERAVAVKRFVYLEKLPEAKSHIVTRFKEPLFEP